ncbi:MAG: thioredoxin domain-containing protein [Campylobacterota bacterium]|nr:thioredoxin domain-containing protein [Campylobacterota bacterium]
MKIKNIAILSILTIALLSGCDGKDKIDENIVVTKNEQKVTQKQQLPNFNLVTSTGKKIVIVPTQDGWKFEGLENKVVLVDFFGTWCPPCKAEIPHLNNIREKLKDDFEILGIDIGSRRGEVTKPTELASFIKDFKIKYPVTTGGDNGKLFGAVSELNPQGSIPFMVLFNKKGEYVKYYIGMKPEEMLFNDISQTIKMK